jgi:PAS domain-containing protein
LWESGGRIETVYSINCKLKVLDLTITPGTWMGKQVVFGVGTDITFQKQAEIELRQKEIKLRLLADYTYDWEYWIDSDGKYVYISQSCERVTGYSPEEFISNPKLISKIIRPDYAEKIHYHYFDEYKKDTQTYSMKFPMISIMRSV